MKKTKIAKLVLSTIILSFIISYIIEESGYYEYQLQTKTELTSESIKQFEQDIKDNKEVDIKDYVVTTNIDYTNNFTKTTNKISTNVNKYLKKSIEAIFKIVNKLVED